MPYLDVLFPESISAGCRVVPKFNNVITRGMSGRRDVQINWDAPLRKFDVSHVVKDRDTLALFLDFWMTVRGTAYSFKFWDPTDYEAGTEYINDQIAYVSQVQIGVGNGSTTNFQLIKTYGAGVNPLVRKITKPILSTVKIYVNGVLQTSGYTINALTGVVTFSVAPPNTHVVAWAGHFYIEASFDSDEPVFQLDSPQVGEWGNITITEERP
jgi:uncharacterized protein (TIGR02217 family)